MSSFTDAVQTAKEVIDAVEKRQREQAEKAKQKAQQQQQQQQSESLVDKAKSAIKKELSPDFTWVWWLLGLWVLTKGK